VSEPTAAAETVETLVHEAVRAIKAYDLAAAESACRDALALDPHHLPARIFLGSVLLAQERFGEASEAFAALIEREPQEPMHWLNLGTACRGLGAYTEALTAYGRAAALGLDDVALHFNLGITHLDRGDLESAYAVLERARNLEPQDAEITLRYAQAAYRSLRNEAAMAALAHWRTLTGLEPAFLAQIAQLLINLGQQREGKAALEQALAEADGDAGALVVSIETLERINRLDEARVLVERLQQMALPPALEQDLLAARARLAQRAGENAEAEALLRESLRQQPDEALHYTDLFPLAAVLDAQQRHAEAWQTLQDAHRSQLLHLRRQAPALVLGGPPPMLITQHSADPADVAGWTDPEAPSLQDSPVFVLAYPRSGTTLLEMTLDAHPGLQSMDEQPFIQDALAEMRERCSYPQGLGKLGSEDLAQLRANYWARVTGRVQLRPGVRLVDKNPLNILRLPVIRRLFPNASVILAVRHPCDVILSCYMQMFRAPEFALLCNTLASTARGYERTMNFWLQQAALLRPRLHELRYETLVSDFEAETRRLVSFLELPWHDAVLRPGEHARAKGFISTPSYAQVVRPVSSKSVGRWQHYTQAFVPVLPLIRPLLEHWHYPAELPAEGTGTRAAS
jgi:tetratricopeptide (TPR) repeat protein